MMKTFFCFFFLCIPAFAITPTDVVTSSLNHFPQVIEALQNFDQAQAKTQQNLGSFDAKVKGEVDTRTQGYYSGDSYKASVEKPLYFLNSKLYAGGRQGLGSFPDYEGKLETLSDGEMFAGISLSLLRDSMIDFNRYQLWVAREAQNQAKNQVQLTKIKVQTMALKAYWTWMIKGHELKVYKSILDIAQVRGRQISKRIQAGDLAAIYETENKQYIRKREAQLAQSRLDFLKASYYLSLFYRNNNGQPQQIDFKQLPPLKRSQLLKIGDSSKITKKAISENIDLKILSSQIKQADFQVQLGQNDLLPKVDVNFEWNQDQGQGPSQLQQDENRILLSLEIPLEFRKGLGKKRSGLAKKEQLKTKRQWTQEKLFINVQSLVAKLNTMADIYRFSTDQVSFATKLAKAERRKFSQGASDLILVNLREENLAEAQVKNLLSLLKYYFIDADLKEVQVNLMAH